MDKLGEKMKQWVLLGAALLFLMQTASAGINFGYYGSDYYFEISTGSSYHYVDVPYSYYQDDYYYFDYPFRYYSSGSYYYFDRGWYGFDDYWTFAPDYGGYYNYYSPSYYYYDSYWTFAPDWINSYATSYYGNYYYPTNYYSTGYYPTTPTLIGQSYQPVQTASCFDADIYTYSVNVTEGETKTVFFYVDNFSNQYIDVANVTIYEGNFDLEISNIKFDREIPNNSSGLIEFDVKAKEGASREIVEAEIKVNATYRDGTFCSGNDIKREFLISLAGPTSNDEIAFDTVVGGGAYHNVQGSTEYRQARESQQEWESVEPQTTYFSDVIDTVESVFTVQTYYGEPQIPASSCNGLNIHGENFAVDSGESKTEYFTLRNYTTEDFEIDFIDAIEYNPGFGIEAYRNALTVYSGQTTSVIVKVNGSETEEDVTGTGYVTLVGHFRSGLSCTISSDSFYVRVNGIKENKFERITINNPGRVELEGNSGFVKFEIDNPTDERITVNVYSNKALVSPTKFVLNPNTLSERTIAINGVSDEAIIYFDIDTDKPFLEKFTTVKATEMQAPQTTVQPQVVAIPIEPSAETEPQEEEGLNGLLATGFAVLNDNVLILGLLVFAIALGLLLLPKEDL